METKKCPRCKLFKNLNDFTKNKNLIDELSCWCKTCSREVNRLYRLKHRKEISEKEKKRRENPDVRNKYLKHYKEYRDKNRELLSNKQKEFYQKNKVKIQARHKEYDTRNKEIIKERKRKYYQKNKEKIKATRRLYINNKLKTDPLFKLKERVKDNIRKSIQKKGFTKKSKTYNILGCTFEEFKIYIENKFEPWMNWENFGGKQGIKEINKNWDLDHIIPLCSAKTEDEVFKLNHYTNFQPLCSYTNRYIKRDIY